MGGADGAPPTLSHFGFIGYQLFDIATEGPTLGMIALTLIDQTATSPGGLALTGATEPPGA